MMPSTIANKRLKKQDQTKEGEVQVDQNATDVDSSLPHLPELIVDKIFRLIPTKLAVRSTIVSKQWKSVWSLGVPFLNFDDEGGCCTDRRKLLFIDFVESCLRHCEKIKLLELESFSLRMRYDCELIDSTRIDKWFSFVLDMCVRELDISIQRKDDDDSVESTYYCIPRTILNAQYLTRLNLQHVRIPENSDMISLPLLKTMSLKAVLFDCYMTMSRSLFKGCPSIERLTLVSCSFSSLGSNWIVVVNSSLKFLQVMYCKCDSISVEAENLESFIFSSDFSQLNTIYLHRECVNLKNISVSAHLSDICFVMPGTCRHNLKATIDIPNLKVFRYDGYLLPNDVISVKARNPLAATLELDWDDEQVLESTFLPPWTHFPTWRDFLKNFDCCNKLVLEIHHDAIAEALTFPENIRKTSSPPLLNLKRVEVWFVRLRCPQTLARISAFTESLRWMAPYALIEYYYWDYGEPASSGEDEPESSGEDDPESSREDEPESGEDE